MNSTSASEDKVDIVLPISLAAAKSLQWCPTLCDPIDGNPPGFAVPGILQARTLEWVAISYFTLEQSKPGASQVVQW